jgi:AcrR family transcriptional regulator
MAASATKTRLLIGALELFAEHGFTATNVAMLQERAGLTGGSGAMYRHFSTKEDLFRSAVEAALTANAERLSTATPPSLDRKGLRALARSGLAALRAQRSVFRVLFRDGDRFPDVRDRFRDLGSRPYFDAFAQLLRTRKGSARRRDHEALSAVLIGAVVHYEMYSTLFGEPPGGVSEARFIAAWADVAAAATGP